MTRNLFPLIFILATIAVLFTEAGSQSFFESPQPASISPEKAIADLNASKLSDSSRITLEKVISTFAKMNSVHMEASVRVFISADLTDDSEDILKNGTFSFWEYDGRFRIKSEIDPRLGLAANMEFAFDGVHYQNVLTEDSVLSIYTEDQHRYSTAVPNPLFLLVDFLSPDKSECPGCVLFLKDFQNESTWSSRMVKARESVSKSSERQVLVPGGFANGVGIIYRISFTDDKLIHKIDQLAAGGDRLTSLDFHHYRPVKEGGPLFPRSVTATVFTADGEVAARIVYAIETLEVGDPISFDVFSINPEKLDVVLDGDTGDYVKYTRN